MCVVDYKNDHKLDVHILDVENVYKTATASFPHIYSS